MLSSVRRLGRGSSRLTYRRSQPVRGLSSQPHATATLRGLLIEYPVRTNAAISSVLCALGDALAQLVEWRLRITSPDKESFNWYRTVRMATFGLAAGPILSGWYRTLALLDTALKVNYAPLVGGWLRRALKRDGSLPSTLFPFLTLHVAKVSEVSAGQVLAAKVVADNLLFQAPFLNLYFLLMGALEGLHPVDILAKTKESFHQAWALSILVWVPVQVVNLGLVPIAYQACNHVPATLCIWATVVARARLQPYVHAMQPCVLVQALVVSLVNVGWKTTLSLLNHYHQYHMQPAPPIERRDSEVHRHNAALESQVAALCAENEELRGKLKLDERTGSEQ